MFELSKKAQDFTERTRKFILEEIEPVEAKFWEEVHELNPDGNWKKWQWPELLETLKSKAKQAGLWNMFLPDSSSDPWLIPPVSPKNGYGETVESCDKKRQVGSANLMDKNAMA